MPHESQHVNDRYPIGGEKANFLQRLCFWGLLSWNTRNQRATTMANRPGGGLPDQRPRSRCRWCPILLPRGRKRPLEGL